MANPLETLTGYIRSEVGYDGNLDVDADLLEEQILDSFSIVEMAGFIQSSFEIELEAEDLTRENFASLASMVALIERRA